MEVDDGDDPVDAPADDDADFEPGVAQGADDAGALSTADRDAHSELTTSLCRGVIQQPRSWRAQACEEGRRSEAARSWEAVVLQGDAAGRITRGHLSC